MDNGALSQLMFALVSLIGVAHGFGYAFQRFGLPRVGGELLGGLVLGPSLLGQLAPGFQAWLFPATGPVADGLSVLYWLGLVMLMFIAGFRVQRHLSADERSTVFAILVAATAVPLAVGWLAVDGFDLTRHQGSAGQVVAFKIVCATAVAVTSIPVISRIFIDIGIMDTVFAKVVLAISTAQDILLWIALALAISIADGGGLSPWEILRQVLVTIAFIGGAMWFGPGLLRILNQMRLNLVLKASSYGYLIAICFLFAGASSVLKVNAVFGALVAGIVVGRLPDAQFESVRQDIHNLALGFLVPVYFALVGLKIDLPRDFDPVLFIGFLILSSLVVVASVVAGAKIARHTWLSSMNLAIAMNTRGGPGIVLASMAYDAGIIDNSLFITLVLTAIVTSIASGAWFHAVSRRGLPLLVRQGMSARESD
jgi:Kef-type K+ transport system membrane component KefB